MRVQQVEQHSEKGTRRLIVLLFGIIAMGLAMLAGWNSTAQAGASPAALVGQKAHNNSPLDCGEWSAVGSPAVTSLGSILYGVKAIADNDIWSVGLYVDSTSTGNQNKTLALHWNGTAWTQVPSPNPDPNSVPFNALYGVDGIASNDVWAVGRTTYGAETMHWDGAAWTAVDVPDY